MSNPKKPDLRPICTCGSYSFPHKLGEGRCDGSDFAEFHWLYYRRDCEYCNLNVVDGCDAQTGAESIIHGDCYEAAKGEGAIDLTEAQEPQD